MSIPYKQEAYTHRVIQQWHVVTSCFVALNVGRIDTFGQQELLQILSSKSDSYNKSQRNALFP
jgi:hypothetical protein